MGGVVAAPAMPKAAMGRYPLRVRLTDTTLPLSLEDLLLECYAVGIATIEATSPAVIVELRDLGRGDYRLVARWGLRSRCRACPAGSCEVFKTNCGRRWRGRRRGSRCGGLSFGVEAVKESEDPSDI